MYKILINCEAYIDGHWRRYLFLVVAGAEIIEVNSRYTRPWSDATLHDLHGARLLPGLIDLQVNGGGGVLFNDAPTLAGLALIVDAHRRLGTTSLLATVITDEWGVMERATDAVVAALRQGLPGLAGIHFEGPFINPAKAGVHHPSRIIAPTDDDVGRLAGLASMVRGAGGRVLVTLAPEIVAPSGIARLVAAGCVVAAGHSAATYEQAMAGFDAGITGATHMFNAMSPLESRAPGLVGAVLARDDVWCSVIADGHHVHAGALDLLWRRKPADKLILVSDAMPPTGLPTGTGTGGSAEFTLYGRSIRSEGGRLVDSDGRLAGAHLDMLSAVRHMTGVVGVPGAAAVAMASANPARALGLADRLGALEPGMAADMLVVDDDFALKAVWVGGKPIGGPDGPRGESAARDQ